MKPPQVICRMLGFWLVVGVLSLGHFATGPLRHSEVSAAVPRLVRYQGQAVDSNGVPLEGPYTLTFRLYDAVTNGTALWTEQHPNVTVTGGNFSVLLGEIVSLDAFDWSQSRWISVQVNSEPELSPRQQITSVPLAIRAKDAEQLGPIVSVGSNVGIGTSTPASQRGFGPNDRVLHLKGLTTGSATGVRLDGPNGASAELYSGGYGELFIEVFGAAQGTNNGIYFQTEDANSATTPSTRMYISSTGNWSRAMRCMPRSCSITA